MQVSSDLSLLSPSTLAQVGMKVTSQKRSIQNPNAGLLLRQMQHLQPPFSSIAKTYLPVQLLTLNPLETTLITLSKTLHPTLQNTFLKVHIIFFPLLTNSQLYLEDATHLAVLLKGKLHIRTL